MDDCWCGSNWKSNAPAGRHDNACAEIRRLRAAAAAAVARLSNQDWIPGRHLVTQLEERMRTAISMLSNVPPSPAVSVPERGQLYRPRNPFNCEVLWVVMAVEPADPFPVKARRCDKDDQTHVGRWTLAMFAEYMERVDVVAAVPNPKSARTEHERGICDEGKCPGCAEDAAATAKKTYQIYLGYGQWETVPHDNEGILNVDGSMSFRTADGRTTFGQGEWRVANTYPAAIATTTGAR